MEKQDELKKIISEVEKDFEYLEKALAKKQKKQFEEKRFEMIEKLKAIERNLR
jgi:hypothetical protein